MLTIVDQHLVTGNYSIIPPFKIDIEKRNPSLQIYYSFVF